MSDSKKKPVSRSEILRLTPKKGQQTEAEWSKSPEGIAELKRLGELLQSAYDDAMVDRAKLGDGDADHMRTAMELHELTGETMSTLLGMDSVVFRSLVKTAIRKRHPKGDTKADALMVEMCNCWNEGSSWREITIAVDGEIFSSDSAEQQKQINAVEKRVKRYAKDKRIRLAKRIGGRKARESRQKESD